MVKDNHSRARTALQQKKTTIKVSMLSPDHTFYMMTYFKKYTQTPPEVSDVPRSKCLSTL